jgi:hypothetical protein
MFDRKKVPVWLARISTELPKLLSVSGGAICYGISQYGEKIGVPHALGPFAGVTGYVFLFVTVFLILRTNDERTRTSSWESALFKRVMPEEPWILCRRHVTGRAQAIVLGCGTAEELENSLRHFKKSILAAVSELTLEKDSGLYELVEHRRILCGLIAALRVVRDMSFTKGCCSDYTAKDARSCGLGYLLDDLPCFVPAVGFHVGTQIENPLASYTRPAHAATP